MGECRVSVVLLVDAYWSRGVGEEDTQGPWGVAGLEPEGGKEGPRGPGWSWPRAKRWEKEDTQGPLV